MADYKDKIIKSCRRAGDGKGFKKGRLSNFYFLDYNKLKTKFYGDITHR
ncbi:MAG: hypothetical protein NC826_06100 [Candidatus Omnitrophica bacterium]|nr:hypothetical protein [Candidatus Omnitrophota bacterium]